MSLRFVFVQRTVLIMPLVSWVKSVLVILLRPPVSFPWVMSNHVHPVHKVITENDVNIVLLDIVDNHHLVDHLQVVFHAIVTIIHFRAMWKRVDVPVNIIQQVITANVVYLDTMVKHIMERRMIARNVLVQLVFHVHNYHKDKWYVWIVQQDIQVDHQIESRHWTILERFILFQAIDVNIVMMDILATPKVLLRVFEDLVNYVVVVEILIRILLAIAIRTSSSLFSIIRKAYLSFK